MRVSLWQGIVVKGHEDGVPTLAPTVVDDRRNGGSPILDSQRKGR